MKRFQDRVAVITGGGHGIGKAYAKHFAMEGAKVIIAELDEKAAQAVAKELTDRNFDALAVATNVADEQSLNHMVEKVMKAYGRMDILINNAAIFATIPITKATFDQVEPDDWDKVMAVNLKGTWLACRAVVPVMKQQGKGKIVNVSSGTVFHGNSGFIHYVTSKSAIIGFTRCLARELGDYNINVNCIAPGNTQSEDNVSEEMRKYRESRLGSRSIKRIQTPEDVVGSVLFLCSDESDFITGQTLVVDGGVVMN
ncbi:MULTISPECIES: 3-oxoacyl-ACP reductase family protein [unclassified Paenibacillus]|uniref:SDR family NAD(P)-dependent oxidoreductase n=1 Tax=unclassified Paenibacillus TaxID=185978 RepID=UPI001AE9E699|nr:MULTISPECIES: 3-oxoacyl-ACP reductase family protein [unclassified Paenibacillus]MBP1154057.1 3-oxoacyl-[acyl-carrier protein] reductase [Paenibacillus sp. PvP091]MBP1170558.1 3-oxoacyl-[acyl-carrier protein] reductase [Paenibacillus sp. PvR098]MBP2441586.1 3-oxoacyl-[acyl-carrier protein] reductase [Paenibacillus sp. PvP052]